MAECGIEMCFTKTINKSVYDDDETTVVKAFAEFPGGLAIIAVVTVHLGSGVQMITLWSTLRGSR